MCGNTIALGDGLAYARRVPHTFTHWLIRHKSRRSQSGLRSLPRSVTRGGRPRYWFYSSILFHLAKQWATDPNFSHGFFVPAFSLFVLWRDRARLAREPREHTFSGWLVFLVSLAMLFLLHRLLRINRGQNDHSQIGHRN